jgi:hypothetical protein
MAIRVGGDSRLEIGAELGRRSRDRANPGRAVDPTVFLLQEYAITAQDFERMFRIHDMNRIFLDLAKLVHISLVC